MMRVCKKTVYLTLLTLFLSSCSGAKIIGRIPLDKDTDVIYVGAHVSRTLSGESISAIDRFAYDPETKKWVLLKSDSSSGKTDLKGMLEKFPLLPLLP